MYVTSVVDPEFKGGKRVIYETTTTVGKKFNTVGVVIYAGPKFMLIC